MSTRRRGGQRPVRLLVGVLVLLLTGACSGAGHHDRGPTDPNDPLVRAWGLGPDPDGEVRLQPDVVVVEGGARTVLGVTDGGLTFRIDPDAGGVDDLEVGKIMFVTSEAIGRVLKLREAEGELLVTIGPVTLVDVIRDGTFQGTDVPIAEAYPRPEPDAPITPASGTATPSPSGRTAPRAPSRVAPAGLLAPTTSSSVVPTLGRRVTGFGTGACCARGAEVSFAFNGGGTRFAGNIRLTMKKLPRANFFVQIKGGTLARAELSVSGEFGVHLDFAAGTNTGANQTIDIPVGATFGVPIGSIGPIPLSMKISQAVILKTAFGTKLGEMHSMGDYTLASSIGFEYTGGGFRPKNATNFHRLTSLIQNMASANVGVMAVLVKHVVHFNLGFNTPLLEAGLYLDVETTIGATAGAGIGAVALLGSHFVQCRGAGLGVSAQVGVGFRLLGVAVDVVNSFLSLLSIKPIPSRIGPPPFRAYLYRDIAVDPPNTQLCGQPGAFGGLVQGNREQGRSPTGEIDPSPLIGPTGPERKKGKGDQGDSGEKGDKGDKHGPGGGHGHGNEEEPPPAQAPGSGNSQGSQL